MHLSHLKLVNFRGFRNLELHLSLGPTILLGANAQGKSTLLEAMYLLAIARAFRAENEREVVNWQAAAGGGQALVDGTIAGAQGRTRVIIGYQTHQASRSPRNEAAPEALSYSVRKEIRVGGVRRTAADLVGLVSIVLFSAEDINLIQGPPALKRRYLDILVSQTDASYLKSLQRYQRVLHQRNQLLRFVQEGRAQQKELEFWDQELAREGAFITQRRGQAMSSISATAPRLLLELTKGREELQVSYQPSVPLEEEAPSMEGRILAALEASRRRDLSLGSTTVGPHRDDFKLLVNGVNMGAFSSRGQARTLALTLRLSEASYQAAYSGEPIVLLDDVLSELDAQRRRQVLEGVETYGQTIITATDVEHFEADFLARAHIYQLRDGSVEPLAWTGNELSPDVTPPERPQFTVNPQSAPK